ncbi:MAG TPA: carbon-phosphorus lyase complex subunit PhnI [Methylomirabilota bacterium]|nr:carbon-phosphorus lyase complex subunit PhnI [Methylomirabilota bacterium]
MYVAVKGGERAIANAHRLLAQERRGDPAVPELSLDQIDQQLGLAVDRVMIEGSLYDRELAALAIKQARGDLIEAIFLARAYRTTLPRFGATRPIDTGAMTIRRRVSATFKDVPGGQILGATFDYTHRLLDFDLATEPAERSPAGADDTERRLAGETAPGGDLAAPGGDLAALGGRLPRVIDILDRDGLIEPEEPDSDRRAVGDLTREPLDFPAARDVRLQSLTRADEGFVLALGYATQRGYGRNHPFAAEIRVGEVEIELQPEELGFPIAIGEITVTECQMVNQFKGSATAPPQFTRGYGLVFGHAERKAMTMALCDRALRCRELGETPTSPAQDEEFVLYHGDNVEASGFVQHLKLPHHVDFQSELVLIRTLRAEAEAPTR